MPYSDFTIRKVKQAFGLTTIEGEKFLPEITPIAPSSTLNEFLAESFTIAIPS
ncbi:MAG: hypothetical protein ACRAVC_13005 [Trichormus sp.]